MQYPWQLPTQFELPRPIVPQSMPVAVSPKTEPPRFVNPSPIPANSSDVGSLLASQPSTATEIPSTAAETPSAQCISIDEELLSFIAEFADSDVGQIDLGLNGGLLGDILNETPASFDSAAAAAAIAAVSNVPQSQAEMKSEPQDAPNTDYMNLLKDLEQLNNLARPM